MLNYGMNNTEQSWEERFEDLFNKKQDLIWEEALKDEFNDITAPRDKYNSELNEQLDSLETELKKEGQLEPYHFVRLCPRNIEWEDLSREKQDLLYYIAWSLKEQYKKEGKKLSLEIKEMKKQRELDLLDNIDKKERELSELKSRLPHQDFDTLEECGWQMVQRANQKKFRTYRAGYRWAVDNCTIKGNPIKNWKQLESAVERYCDANKHIPITERMRRSLEED